MPVQAPTRSKLPGGRRAMSPGEHQPLLVATAGSRACTRSEALGSAVDAPARSTNLPVEPDREGATGKRRVPTGKGLGG